MTVIIKLREAMQSYYRRTGKRMTYVKLAEATGISEDTIESIGGRNEYLPGLTTVEKLCRALEVEISEMVEIVDDPPSEPEPSPKTTKKKKKTTKKKKKKIKKAKK
ncbi:MAG: helix-turn-helix transcriptional regulator [Phycisphaerales bacterium]|nr:helix-turn-helix transcriptional regulator [Phycisphaerales bacterium]